MSAFARAVLGMTLLLTGCAAGAAGGMEPSATVTTTLPGFTDTWFKVDFTVEPRGEALRASGYVYNNYGRPVGDVRVLAQALDASNRLVGQRLAWVPGGIPALSRSYFEVGPLPPADHYRVSVWSYTVLEGGGHRFP
ncbi:MAG: hypothetical protein HY294_07835 [Candidatus Rokubacteria bacterium]|nr:hypothetical protein [Candidatus Rokubacteria bacterium]